MNDRVIRHEAMNTTFSLRLAGDAAGLAGDLAFELFHELDRLEDKLSRFREDSEVTRINRLRAGESLRLSEECDACLRLALDLHGRTGGRFDVTLGRAIEHRKGGGTGPAPASTGQLALDPTEPMISCLEPGREIDLGGIGKGFALDQLNRRLDEWDAPDSLLAAGASTQLARGGRRWPIELRGEAASHGLELGEAALSASGTRIQGAHVVHPDPDWRGTGWTRLWVIAASAAEADAWSTAAMLMDRDELLGALAGDSALRAVFIEQDGEPLQLGEAR